LINRADQDGIVLVDLPAGQTQRRTAFAVALVLLGSAAGAAPFASVQLRQFEAFIPVSQTFIFVNDLITSVLLIAQFVIVRWRAILVLASGYLFTALIDVTQLLTFPGTFTPTGLLGPGLQTTGWLYEFWHSGFPIAVILYVVLKNQAPENRVSHKSARAAVAISVAVVIGMVFGLSWLATAGEEYLPKLFLDRSRQAPAAAFFSGLVLLVSIVALLMLWFRQRSVLDLWLMVAMCAWSLDIVIQTLAGSRFTLGFYASRVYALVTATTVLIVLLWETMTLYARLALSGFAQRREREARLMTGDVVAASIAHEVRQPLTAMVTSADAGFRFLDRSTPNLDRAKEAFKLIAADGHRAGAVVENIRANFRHDVRTRTSLDVNELIRETLALERSDLEKHRIRVQAEPNKQLSEVRGNRGQLQQVLLNLIANAIYAMAAKDEPRVLCVKSEAYQGDSVMVSVTDTGTGVSPQDIDRIFNPLFTTKSDGMGMGLSICRAIIEAHDGRLWFVPNTPRGAVFRFILHADHSVPAGA
jgi:signal transduction histidine kinase